MIYVPIALPYHNKMGPQRKLGIYVRYDSLSTIKYLEIQMRYVFKAQFAECKFDKIMFPTLGEESRQLEKEVNWYASFLLNLDPRARHSELEVQMSYICKE